MSAVIQSTFEGYPSPTGRVILTRVLTLDDTMHQVAAYVGVLPDLGADPAPAELEWIAGNGSKLTEREARGAFTFPAGTEYRR